MAAEFAASASANAVGNLATEYASPYVSYFFRFGKIVEEFRNWRKQLELKKDRVQNDVDAAVRQTEVIEKDVQEWLKEAEKELEQTKRLEVEIERQKCFNWCPNWGWRYCLSKKVAKTTPRITKLLQRCDFQRMGICPPLQGIEFFPSKDFKSSKSSDLAFNEIIRALNTNGVNMIGLYGMPGVGKTTLAKEIGKHAKEQKLFDNVVIVTMSQSPNINKIQDKIAGLLDLKFKASFQEGKAEELWRRLKEVKKILIIIDDVWNEFRLQTIGIPFGVEHEGCKILLTTRLQQVCVRMNCQEKFRLNILSEDEAWALFQDNAGLQDASSTLNDVAKEVAFECNGLPLAIITIGKALKGADLNGWKAANQRFKDSRHFDNKDVCEGIYSCLKLSYDYLNGDDIRSCFLLCSLFPEDFVIAVERLIERLVMLGIGHGLFSNVYSIEVLRMEIGDAIRKLQESGLLLKIDDGDDDEKIHVSMHDVVRDFAHWITMGEKNIFMVKEGLTEWPIRESFECYTSISFWSSRINSFPDKLEYPNLKILVFEGEDSLRVPIPTTVPTTFVEGMKALRILHLKNISFSLEVFKVVKNLRTLCFEKCKLKNISSLKYLENLEILALLETNVYELPEELVVLHRLKSLHFSFSRSQQNNFPTNMLSRLTSLQELHVTCPNNVNLSELNSLSSLTALSLRISTDQCFPENFVFPKLQRYMIAVNKNLEYLKGLNFRTLKIEAFSSSLNAFKELFCNVEKLALQNVVMVHKNIVPSIDQEGLNELTSLELECCDAMECLIDTTGEKEQTTAFSSLVKLYVKDMPCLKELCHGLPPIRFFQKLKDVNIVHCVWLKVLFQVDELVQREEINQTPLLSNLTSLDLFWLPKLESIWKLQPTHQYPASLRSLKVVAIDSCDELKFIFPTWIAQSLLHLQQLIICDCKGLERVFDFPQETTELEVPPLSNLTSLELKSLPELKWIWKGPTHLLSLRSLKTMRIGRCLKLTYLFTTSLAQSLVHLEVLQIWNCDSLEHVIMEEAENEDEIISNMLQHHYVLSCPKLRTLKITNCGSLKYVFPITLAPGLPYLESIEITRCSQLKQVFKMTRENDRCQQDIVLRKLQMLKLENLDTFSGFCQENFVLSPSFKEFEVRNCPQLNNLGNLQGVALQAEFKENQVPPLSNLTDLKLHKLPKLKWIWKGSTRLVNLQSLRIIVASGCSKLAYLFPKVLAQNLVHLEELHISSCQSLKHVIMEAENEDEIVSNMGGELVFKRLQVVKLENLDNFSSFCPEKNFMSLSLKEFEVRNCPRLTEQGIKTLQSHLEEVRVINCGQWQQVFQTEEFLHDMDENEAPMLSNLTALELESLPELKWIWKEPNNYVCLQSLKIAEISRCHKLKSLFSPSVAQSLVLLQQLKIKDCEGLECITTELEIDDNIESNSVHVHPQLLPKLTTLEISDCPRLNYVFQIPLAQVLPELKSVSITDSPQLKHVFSVAKVNNGVNRGAIELPCLQHLQLQNLINLRCFCSENHPIVSPSLEYLTIKVCPRLEIFTIQQEVNKHLQRKGLIQVANFQVLRELRVSNCKGRKSLFSFMLAQNLLKLKLLSIQCCEELEEIIEMDRTSIASSSQGHFQPISFPSLEAISIHGCSNLKSFFPISVARSLSKVKHIEIHGSSKLEQVFGFEDDLSVGDVQMKIVFPKLKGLKLSELPSLKSFAPMGYCFQFPFLEYFKVAECLKLIISFSMDSKHPVHGITEESQQVQTNTMEEIVDDESTSGDDESANSDIFSIPWGGQMPLYMTLGETRIMLLDEVKITGETC